MQAEPDGDIFLCAAMEWADTRFIGLARELVSCHALFKAGQYAAVLARLRAACGLTGTSVGTVREADRAETIAVAADLLDTLRLRLGRVVSS